MQIVSPKGQLQKGSSLKHVITMAEMFQLNIKKYFYEYLETLKIG